MNRKKNNRKIQNKQIVSYNQKNELNANRFYSPTKISIEIISEIRKN